MSINEPLRVALIVGSTRTDRFGPTPAHWIAERAREHGGIDVDYIDLLEARLPETLPGDDEKAPRPGPVVALGVRLAAADAFIVVTPVYNRGYPASLKTAIDWFFDEWSAKPVGFVSYGGVGGGLHAVEQLRQVFNEVHAATIRHTIGFANFWERFDDRGEPVERAETHTAAQRFLDQLLWWGEALREARGRRPYKT
ncbi:NAD(P)H-dependent oxidoreductase [Streptomyces sp. NBC_01511]|uniref:NADPH-dependent FMN reductase n=1 Tax=unclassified Streptomyces TaxID=2593676 RepID=UPI00386BA30D